MSLDTNKKPLIIKIDKTKCIGCGTCIALNSQVFSMGDDGIAQVNDQSSIDKANIQEAIDCCPVQAILIVK